MDGENAKKAQESITPVLVIPESARESNGVLGVALATPVIRQEVEQAMDSGLLKSWLKAVKDKPFRNGFLLFGAGGSLLHELSKARLGIDNKYDPVNLFYNPWDTIEDYMSFAKDKGLDPAIADKYDFHSGSDDIGRIMENPEEMYSRQELREIEKVLSPKAFDVFRECIRSLSEANQIKAEEERIMDYDNGAALAKAFVLYDIAVRRLHEEHEGDELYFRKSRRIKKADGTTYLPGENNRPAEGETEIFVNVLRNDVRKELLYQIATSPVTQQVPLLDMRPLFFGTNDVFPDAGQSDYVKDSANLGNIKRDDMEKHENLDTFIGTQALSWNDEEAGIVRSELAGYFSKVNDDYYYGKSKVDLMSMTEGVKLSSWDDVKELSLRMSQWMYDELYGLVPDLLDRYGFPDKASVDSEACQVASEAFSHVQGVCFNRRYDVDGLIGFRLQELNRFSRQVNDHLEKADPSYMLSDHILSYSSVKNGQDSYSLLRKEGHEVVFAGCISGLDVLNRLDAIMEGLKRDYPQVLDKGSGLDIRDVSVSFPVGGDYSVSARVGGIMHNGIHITRQEAMSLAEGNLEISQVVAKYLDLGQEAIREENVAIKGKPGNSTAPHKRFSSLLSSSEKDLIYMLVTSGSRNKEEDSNVDLKDKVSRMLDTVHAKAMEKMFLPTRAVAVLLYETTLYEKGKDDFCQAVGIKRDVLDSYLTIVRMDSAFQAEVEDNAIRSFVDRACSPTGRAFTQGQKEALKLYFDEFALLDESYRKSDGQGFSVDSLKDSLLILSQDELRSRDVPSKWVNDARNELQDLANGVERSEGAGIRL